MAWRRREYRTTARRRSRDSSRPRTSQCRDRSKRTAGLSSRCVTPPAHTGRIATAVPFLLVKTVWPSVHRECRHSHSTERASRARLRPSRVSRRGSPRRKYFMDDLKFTVGRKRLVATYAMLGVALAVVIAFGIVSAGAGGTHHHRHHWQSCGYECTTTTGHHGSTSSSTSTTCTTVPKTTTTGHGSTTTAPTTSTTAP